MSDKITQHRTIASFNLVFFFFAFLSPLLYGKVNQLEKLNIGHIVDVYLYCVYLYLPHAFVKCFARTRSSANIFNVYR